MTNIHAIQICDIVGKGENIIEANELNSHCNHSRE